MRSVERSAVSSDITVDEARAVVAAMGARTGGGRPGVPGRVPHRLGHGPPGRGAAPAIVRRGPHRAGRGVVDRRRSADLGRGDWSDGCCGVGSAVGQAAGRRGARRRELPGGTRVGRPGVGRDVVRVRAELPRRPGPRRPRGPPRPPRGRDRAGVRGARRGPGAHGRRPPPHPRPAHRARPGCALGGAGAPVAVPDEPHGGGAAGRGPAHADRPAALPAGARGHPARRVRASARAPRLRRRDAEPGRAAPRRGGRAVRRGRRSARRHRPGRSRLRCRALPPAVVRRGNACAARAGGPASRARGAPAGRSWPDGGARRRSVALACRPRPDGRGRVLGIRAAGARSGGPAFRARGRRTPPSVRRRPHARGAAGRDRRQPRRSSTAGTTARRCSGSSRRPPAARRR